MGTTREGKVRWSLAAFALALAVELAVDIALDWQLTLHPAPWCASISASAVATAAACRVAISGRGVLRIAGLGMLLACVGWLLLMAHVIMTHL